MIVVKNTTKKLEINANQVIKSYRHNLFAIWITYLEKENKIYFLNNIVL